VDCADYGDIVEAHLKGNGSLRFRQIVEKSPFVLHGFILNRAVVESEWFQDLLDEVLDAGGHWDIDFGACVFIYLPKDCTIDPWAVIANQPEDPFSPDSKNVIFAPNIH
jgi:hypothetical protein